MVHQYNYCIANNLYICCTYTRTWISRFKVRWCSPVKQRSAYTVYFRHNDLLLIYHVVNYSKLLEVQHSSLSIPLPCKMAHLSKSCIILRTVLCMSTTALNNGTSSSQVSCSAPNLDKQYPLGQGQSILLLQKNPTHLIRLAFLMTF